MILALRRTITALRPALRRLTPWDRTVAAASLLLALVTLGELTGEIAGVDAAPAVDKRISVAVAELRSDRLTDAVHVLTSLGGTSAVWIVAAVAVVGALRKRGLRLAFPVLGAVLATTVVVLVMKGVIARERPPAPINPGNSTPAYPSGHSAHAIGTWGAMIWMTCTGCSPTVKLLGAVTGFVVAAGVGFSRVYLGVHWPSDVVAGWAVGGICLSAAILAHRREPPLSDPAASTGHDRV